MPLKVMASYDAIFGKTQHPTRHALDGLRKSIVEIRNDKAPPRGGALSQ